MELHSYAKRKVPKKWSTDQKRQLVEARINHDGFFTNKPTASVAPWKKIVALAKLDDYNVFFVRKQWSNMVNKYKQYKQNRLDVIPNGAIDNEVINKITQEWEFFEPIHRFMSHKTTNLHSYALPITIRMPMPNSAPDELDNHSYNSSDGLDVFSSDTNDNFHTSNNTIELKTQPNTDHDYTKKNGLPLNYFADVSNDTQESMLVEQPLTCNGVTEGMEQVRLHVAGEQIVEMKMEPQSDIEKTAEQIQVQPQATIDTNMEQQMPSTSGSRLRSSQRRASERQVSEKDRYYQHKRRFNRRLERRFDAILNVFGQIVKAEYPNINVNPIMGAATQSATLLNRLFKSESDDDESADEDNKSSTDAEQMQFTTIGGQEDRQ